MFEEEDCEAVLLVDATNAFNSLNRATSLLNVQHICPEFAVFIITLSENQQNCTYPVENLFYPMRERHRETTVPRGFTHSAFYLS